MSSRLPRLPLLTICLFLGIFVFLFYDLDTKAKLTLFLCFTATGVLSSVFAIKSENKSPLFTVSLICISGVIAICSLLISHDLVKSDLKH